MRRPAGEKRSLIANVVYAARRAALVALVEGLDDLPWARYELARAAAERDAWLAGGSASLHAQYVAWQLASGAAQICYAQTRAAEYRQSASATAGAVLSHALQLAGATRQQVQNAVGAQQAFAGHVARATLAWRQARFGHEASSQEALNADAAYKTAFAVADLTRRQELAGTSAAFVAGAGSALVAQTGAILTAQQSFDATIRQAWYASPTSGLEATLAALNYQDDLAEAAAFTGGAATLAAATGRATAR